MKPRTINKSIRITESCLENWNILKEHRIRVADIFKQAGEKAINNTLKELKIELTENKLPF
jgi:hypothetical protein